MREGIRKHKLFFIVTTGLLFLSFAFDVFGTVSTDDFIQNYKDSEALVVNQVVCKGQLFADQLLEQKKPDVPIKSLQDCSAKNLQPYSSQFGLGGKLYTAGFIVVSKLGNVNPHAYAAAMELLTALLSAFILALLVLWVRLRIGIVSAVTVGILIALSPMIVGFARNLYWAFPLLILPLIYVLYYYNSKATRRQMMWFLLGLGVLLYLRFLCGYEYITTITMMVMAAATYGLAMHKAKRIEFAKHYALLAGVAVLAFGAALVTHIGALNLSTGSTSRSVEIIMKRAEERTVNADKYLQYPYMNLKNLANDNYRVMNSYLGYEKRVDSGSRFWATFVALSTYLLLPVVHVPIVLAPSFGLYLQSMTSFIILLGVLYMARKKWMIKRLSSQTYALFLALAVGLIGYGSWLVLGYSHSLVHAHINGILMYLPFALFGYMIIGLYIEFLIGKFRKKPQK